MPLLWGRLNRPEGEQGRKIIPAEERSLASSVPHSGQSMCHYCMGSRKCCGPTTMHWISPANLEEEVSAQDTHPTCHTKCLAVWVPTASSPLPAQSPSPGWGRVRKEGRHWWAWMGPGVLAESQRGQTLPGSDGIVLGDPWRFSLFLNSELSLCPKVTRNWQLPWPLASQGGSAQEGCLSVAPGENWLPHPSRCMPDHPGDTSSEANVFFPQDSYKFRRSHQPSVVFSNL